MDEEKNLNKNQAGNVNNAMNKNRSATIFRLSSFIPIILFLIIVYIIFSPTLSMIIAGIFSGITISIHDFIIEFYAYKKELWLCYGGFQKIGKYNLHVPLDMSILFFIGGLSLGIFSTFPEYLREKEILNGLFSNPMFDWIWILVILVIIALIGAAADFISKRFGVWENGKNWTFWKCAFFAWLPLLIFSVVVNYLVLFGLEFITL
ncbi:MAG: hypothetical protein GF329_22090 [Candidatus Lokiarchaeota archaeon]|nr:hypothetical protein [Candidatus Lokiarchaeota archaeon]